MIPYGNIIPIVVAFLLLKFAISPANSYRSKTIVVALAAGALFCAFVLPALKLLAWIVLAGIGVYLAVHRHLNSSK
jgi:hypothetical protein